MWCSGARAEFYIVLVIPAPSLYYPPEPHHGDICHTQIYRGFSRGGTLVPYQYPFVQKWEVQAMGTCVGNGPDGNKCTRLPGKLAAAGTPYWRRPESISSVTPAVTWGLRNGQENKDYTTLSSASISAVLMLSPQIPWAWDLYWKLGHSLAHLSLSSLPNTKSTHGHNPDYLLN